MSLENNEFTKSFIENSRFHIVNYHTKDSSTFYTHTDTTQTIYVDDTIDIVLHKINFFMCENYQTDSSQLFVWFTLNDKIVPLSFQYDSTIELSLPYESYTIDSHFVDKSGNPKFQTKITKHQLLLQSIQEQYELKTMPTLYFLHLDDVLRSFSIPERKHTQTNWPSEFPSLKLFYYGWIQKYWPDVTYSVFTNQKKSKPNRKKKQYIETSSTIINEMIQFYNQKQYLSCKETNIQFLKIDLQQTQTLPILKLFSEYKLSSQVPFMKLILDDYADSYYKVWKRSVLDESISEDLLNFWIHDFKIDNDTQYTSFLKLNYALVFKLYINTNYISLILTQDGMTSLLLKVRD